MGKRLAEDGSPQAAIPENRAFLQAGLEFEVTGGCGGKARASRARWRERAQNRAQGLPRRLIQSWI